METQRIEQGLAYRLVGHGPVVLVSTYDDAGVPDASAVAWHTPKSKDPPRFALCIGEKHKTYDNLMSSGACILNVPTADRIADVMVCGRVSGHDGDKLTPAGIETVNGTAVNAPRLVGCAAWIECRLLDTMEGGGERLVLVEAALAECRPGVIDPDGRMDVERFPTIHHLGDGVFLTPHGVRTLEG